MPKSFPRVMWLLNHTSARKFEIAMLKRIGFKEIFLPKVFPQSIAFRSGSVDRSEDASLSIPADDLALLNATNWYGQPGHDAWHVANRHFDLLFFMLHRPAFLPSLSRNFRGAAVLRAYGWRKGGTYSSVLNSFSQGIRTVENMGRRFSFGAAYEGLADKESKWFQDREVYLPIGLNDCQVRDHWAGDDPRMFFVCPDVIGIPYYAGIYKEFKENFAGFPYVVGGAQALATNDPHILGFVPDDQHDKNMRELRVMYYHSTEPNHVHYHPFEAVRAGMPLVFMAGGMLDKLGGSALPGRCRNHDEARSKLRRILEGDRALIETIRTSQPVLLEKMRPEILEPAWRHGISQVLSDLEIARTPRPTPARRPRIAVVLPVAYRGGTLRGAKLLALAIWSGSRKLGEDAEVVLAYPAENWVTNTDGPDAWDVNLPEYISTRAIRWRELEADGARRAMQFAGHPDWQPSEDEYLVPDDGRNNLCDCDVWVVISDRLRLPLLPIRPHVVMVYDYIQRYDGEASSGEDDAFISAARAAERILVTTHFTCQDALAYAGLPREKVFRVPMLTPRFMPLATSPAPGNRPYFLWTTNRAPHKNHATAFCALREYFEKFDGQLDCCVSGVNTGSLLTANYPHLAPLKVLVAESEELSRRLRILGELPDQDYRRMLAGAAFLWHPARIDNGTLAVVEAAAMGVPSLSSRYPAMEEMNDQFQLHLTWMESNRPSDMAQQLKRMEGYWEAARAQLPAQEELARYGVDEGGVYWSVIRECL